MTDNNEELTLEELEALIQGESQKQNKIVKKNVRENKAVLLFIRNNNIEPGENKVPTYLIYYQFVLWIEAHCPTRRAGHTEFFRTFGNRFEQKRDGRQRYYMLNDALDCSPEAYRRAEFHRDRRRRKHEKRQEIKKQISGIK